ncbi:hypothetical protein D777_02028 [Marinobacter nitratireducens]|uniref:WbqC-like protein n=1 Tax=Marinobacter nitratireducens TaxID=1137280 RepID=A0A072N1Y5_9GAMM|nr:WbqC family protein [Marinobacter nitratireducens]KEF31679.1 hypothetical protein D777_02028 [Marinobacter nitratireducens]
MNLAIMQPYFFPYLGYFQLMASVDQWVVFDDIQFVNKGWVNRNRVLHPDVNKEWSYITVPLVGKNRFDRITDISVSDDNWRDKMRGQLSFLKRRAPFFGEAMDFFNVCVDQHEHNLASFLTESLRRAAEILGIAPVFRVQSEAAWDLSAVEHSGQWALEISALLGASRYINPVGGKELFNAAEFEARGIELAFHHPALQPYTQGGRAFVPGLSILDVLMWNGVEGTRKHIQEGTHDFGN